MWSCMRLVFFLFFLCAKLEAYDFALAFTPFNGTIHDSCSDLQPPTLGGTNSVSCFVDPSGLFSYTASCSADGSEFTISKYDTPDCSSQASDVAPVIIGGCYTGALPKGNAVSVTCAFTGANAAADYLCSDDFLGGFAECPFNKRNVSLSLSPHANNDCVQNTWGGIKYRCSASGIMTILQFASGDLNCARDPFSVEGANFPSECTAGISGILAECTSGEVNVLRDCNPGSSGAAPSGQCLGDPNSGTFFTVTCTQGDGGPITIQYFSDGPCTVPLGVPDLTIPTNSCQVLTPQSFQPTQYCVCKPPTAVKGPGTVALTSDSPANTQLTTTSFTLQVTAAIQQNGLTTLPTFDGAHVNVTDNGQVVTCDTTTFDTTTDIFTCTFSALASGPHTFTVTYKGDPINHYDPSNTVSVDVTVTTPTPTTPPTTPTPRPLKPKPKAKAKPKKGKAKPKAKAEPKAKSNKAKTPANKPVKKTPAKTSVKKTPAKTSAKAKEQVKDKAVAKKAEKKTEKTAVAKAQATGAPSVTKPKPSTGASPVTKATPKPKHKPKTVAKKPAKKTTSKKADGTK